MTEHPYITTLNNLKDALGDEAHAYHRTGTDEPSSPSVDTAAAPEPLAGDSGHFKAILAQTTSILRETGDIKKEGTTMKSNHFPVLVVALIIALSLCLSAPAPAADSTSFNPTTVTVRAETSGGVPIGTIVAWPVEKNPADWHKWLECNGQTIDPQVYPELATLIGTTVPDLRGQFLRGLGGKSGSLRQNQSESIYIAPNSVTMTHQGMDWSWIRTEGYYDGYDYYYYGYPNLFPKNLHPQLRPYGYYNHNFYYDLPLFHPVSGSSDFSEYVTLNSGASEIRPANMAVRYLIKASK